MALALSWLFIFYPRQPGPNLERRLTLHLRRELPLGEVAEKLGAAGIVARPRLWSLYARALGAAGQWRDRQVVITDDLTPAQVLRRVAKGFGTSWMRVTIPEGATRFDIGARLDALGVCDRSEFLRLTGGAADNAGAATKSEPGRVDSPLGGHADLEGYLFPDTYEMEVDGTCQAVVDLLQANWRRRVEPTLSQQRDNLTALQQELGFGIREVLTLASIVEKEAAVAAEQPIIAGVFLNRLRSPRFRPKRLQADPTVSYGCRAKPTVACGAAPTKAITAAMLADADNPYNTYRIEGLPPGPISNPGLAAILAVLKPAEHSYFYFVASGNGRHHFSAELADHQRASLGLRRRP